jgi:DNA-binding NtrC family response regulator
MNIFEEIKDKKILLIDDDESIRDSLTMFFQGEGIFIDTLETAEEGMKVLENQHYDIIITDYKLPGMDGLSFLKLIQGFYPDAFKILITAYGSSEIINTAKSFGMDEYIEKPFTTKLIKDALSRMLSKEAG